MIYHLLTMGPQLAKVSKCSKRQNAQISKVKMQNNKMHKIETSGNTLNRNFGSERGEREFTDYLPCESPRHVTQ